jgi:hypothetical protein
MTVSSSKARVAEFGEFVSSHRLTSPLEDKSTAQSLAIFDSEFFGLLLWGLERDVYSDRVLEGIDLHFRECLSDIASSAFCAVSNFHKPAMMALRSATENFVKFTLLASGQTIDTKSTYELNDRFKAVFAEDHLRIRLNVFRILEAYVNLCGYVHSASPTYMSLKVSFAEMAVPNPAKTVEVLELAQELSKLFSGVMLKICGSPTNLHHKQADYVLDRLPRALKRAVSNSEA